MPIINDTMREAADRRIGADHAYVIKFGPKAFGTAVAVALLTAVAFGVRWLLHHLPTLHLSVPTPNTSGVPFGWITLALVASLVAVLVVRRIVRHVKYGA